MGKEIFVSNSPEETVTIAHSLGSKLRGGEIIILRSDIGGGKTTFTKGIVKGAGGDTSVTSPTFTIQQQYKTPHVIIYHYDLYRLNELGLLQAEIEEALLNPKVTVVAEWPDIASQLFSNKDIIVVDIIPDGTDENARAVTIQIPDVYGYISFDKARS